MWMGLDVLTLARAQFAFTISFHIVLPAFSIGLASYLAVLEFLDLRTGKSEYRKLFDYWKKIFAVVFGMGVVSGLVMSYEFGTNWSVFSDKAGPVIGPLMGYEVFSAFFLEAGFLGVMLFGRERVGPRLHFFATLMVATGTLVSATWILMANSWMQTPQGFEINAAGQFIPTDWWKVMFTPSFPYRLVHMVLAAYLTTALVVGGVGAFHVLRHKGGEPASRRMLSMAMWMATLVAPIQIIAGDLHGLNTLEYQPAKVAAMEGDYETRAGQPLILFGIPDDEAEMMRYTIEIPRLGSLILTHSVDGVVKGLKDFPKDKRPNASIVFWSFRLMVGIGFAIFGLGLWSLYLRWRGKLYATPLFLWAAAVMTPAGFIAVLAGWVTTEVGRQPYTVYGFLLTKDSLSPVPAPLVGFSLLAFVLTYFVVFGAGALYIARLFFAGPEVDVPALDEGPLRSASMSGEGGNHA
ncbi:cytochrome ubiquinol oxidase subunit I [Aestuariivirga litoralis]|uniref:cytochrome ubiquinol oxidase subunit I n=1 Tax=Aestuariivirga litoralis TaxID=2650924 RepID=UPI0018C6A190|nr:cytochrome ubiquinol oxidase subunit I [Aestuariivirga litoralis]MBG1233032.1 cytochrome ubiquinol oxidase subunit I [Aestuariivirga litoralis]